MLINNLSNKQSAIKNLAWNFNPTPESTQKAHRKTPNPCDLSTAYLKYQETLKDFLHILKLEWKIAKLFSEKASKAFNPWTLIIVF